jgi:hypothetical protein
VHSATPIIRSFFRAVRGSNSKKPAACCNRADKIRIVIRKFDEVLSNRGSTESNEFSNRQACQYGDAPDLFLLTGNAGEIRTLFLAPFPGPPLLSIHILRFNRVTDGLPGLDLTAEPASGV